MIKRPQKALSEPLTDEQLRNDVVYPVYCSPKLDGIRAVIMDKVYSATLKPIGNRHIQKCLSYPEYIGLDGELVVGLPYLEDPEDDVFNRTTGPVRRADGKPDFKFYVFDDFEAKHNTYNSRWLSCKDDIFLDHVVVLEQVLCNNAEEVIAYEQKCVDQGYEGIMVRRADSSYKEGRTTLKEMNIFKRKPVEDDEAIILSCYEQLENLNEKVTDKLGLSKRSGHKDNKIPKNTLGGFTCKSIKYGWVFNVGTIKGGVLEWRKKIWEQYKFDPSSIQGQIIKYKFQKYGSIDAPRQPIMKGFRDPSDMTKY